MGVLLSVWQVYVTRWRTDKCVEARPGWGRRADILISIMAYEEGMWILKWIRYCIVSTPEISRAPALMNGPGSGRRRPPPPRDRDREPGPTHREDLNFLMKQRSSRGFSTQP
jgi:hypothetical protein